MHAKAVQQVGERVEAGAGGGDLGISSVDAGPTS